MESHPKLQQIQDTTAYARRLSKKLARYLKHHEPIKFVEKIQPLENFLDGYELKFRTMGGKVYLHINNVELGYLHVMEEHIIISKSMDFHIAHQIEYTVKSLDLPAARIINFSDILVKVVLNKIGFFTEKRNRPEDGRLNFHEANAVLEQIEFMIT